MLHYLQQQHVGVLEGIGEPAGVILAERDLLAVLLLPDLDGPGVERQVVLLVAHRLRIGDAGAGSRGSSRRGLTGRRGGGLGLGRGGRGRPRGQWDLGKGLPCPPGLPLPPLLRPLLSVGLGTGGGSLRVILSFITGIRVI